MSTPQHPEALRLANELDAEFAQGRISNHTGRKAATELRRQHARIAELEAQLESIGAGGVSGTLMDRAPLAASAGSEPVAVRDAIAHFRLTHWADEDGGLGLADALSKLYGDDDIGRANEELDALADAISEVVTHPSPPEGMAGGWMPIETAPKDGTAILLGSRGGSWIGKWLPVYVSGYRPENPWSSLMLNHDHMGEKWVKPTHWMPLPPPPTTPAGSGNGE